MGELAEFLKVEKTDSFNDLLCGMRYSSYIHWSGFVIPSFSEDDFCSDSRLLEDFKFYTNVKICTRKDIQSLFYMSVAEACADSVKTLYGGIDFSLCYRCQSPAEFIETIDEIKEKVKNEVELKSVLAINSDSESNLFLAQTFIENKSFSGLILAGKSFSVSEKRVQDFEEIFAAARDLSLKTEITCVGIEDAASLYRVLSYLKPSHIKDITPELCDEKILDFIKQSGVCAELSPHLFCNSKEEKAKKARFIRFLYDNGVPVHLCTGNLLLLKKSLSEFASDIMDYNVFSKEELKNILSGV